MQSLLTQNQKNKATTSPYYGINIEFLAQYIFSNPGCTGTEARKALCGFRGKHWSNDRAMRGQYTSYFNQGWIGHNWTKNPCGRYWRRIRRTDGKTGHVLTTEGISKIK